MPDSCYFVLGFLYLCLSILSMLFVALLTIKQPENVMPPRQCEGEVAINISYSKSHDPRTYNYITETGKNALLGRIKDDFDIDVWDYLHDFGKVGAQQKDLNL